MRLFVARNYTGAWNFGASLRDMPFQNIHKICGRDMGPSDFHLFGNLKKQMAFKLFHTDTNVKQAVAYCLRSLYTDFFYAVTQALVPQWDKCLNVSGDCVEVCHVPSATHVPCIFQSQNKVFSIKKNFHVHVSVSITGHTDDISELRSEALCHTTAPGSFFLVPFL
jgi:hypothetical protein